MLDRFVAVLGDFVILAGAAPVGQFGVAGKQPLLLQGAQHGVEGARFHRQRAAVLPFEFPRNLVAVHGPPPLMQQRQQHQRAGAAVELLLQGFGGVVRSQGESLMLNSLVLSDY